MKQKSSRCRTEYGQRYHPVKTRKPGLFSAFADAAEELSGPGLQLRGGRILDVDGCTAVLACDENIIRFRTKESIIPILGTGLETSDFSAYTLTIRGEIRSIELEPAPVKGGKG